MHGSAVVSAGSSTFLSKKHQCLALLKLCSSIKHLYQLHAQIQICGLQSDSFLATELIRVCSLSSRKNLNHARTILSRLANPPPAAWNLLIRGYSSSDDPRGTILLFRQMLRGGITPNNLTFPFVLNACASSSSSSCSAVIKEGEQVHAHVAKSGLDCSDVYVGNNLIHFYGSCKRVSRARKVFDKMPERSVVSWNAVITACVGCSSTEDAIRYFREMKGSGFEPDEATMVVMLSLCAEVGNLRLGKLIHSQVIEQGMELTHQLGTALVDMYSKAGNLVYAMSIFESMKEKRRNAWTWSAMILGLAQHGFAKQALLLFRRMISSTSSSIQPNYVTFLGVLSACSHAGLVQEGFNYFHEMQHKYGIKPTAVHYGAMVDILARAGYLKEAYEFASSMPCRRDPIVWRTLLGACRGRNCGGSDGELVEEVRRRLLELEPRRSGNLVMVANLYAGAGMWERVEDVRKGMRDGGLKTRGGESWIELGGSVHQFFSGCGLEEWAEEMNRVLIGLDLHVRMVHFD
ncbi:unnamed protein product [Linum tenue]|uniref:Pentatricopeptide repeat-containing protein n=1 Tax=Linum tenue TaxID=586396 RepID=A0AAV0JW32_9ROSI|nr:unnamed protein product [Linum tenue]